MVVRESALALAMVVTSVDEIHPGCSGTPRVPGWAVLKSQPGYSCAPGVVGYGVSVWALWVRVELRNFYSR